MASWGGPKVGTRKKKIEKIKSHVSQVEAYQFLASDCHSRSRTRETKRPRGNPSLGPPAEAILI